MITAELVDAAIVIRVQLEHGVKRCVAAPVQIWQVLSFEAGGSVHTAFTGTRPEFAAPLSLIDTSIFLEWAINPDFLYSSLRN